MNATLLTGGRTEHEVRDELRHLARIWAGPQRIRRSSPLCAAVAQTALEERLRDITSPHLPQHTEGICHCGCLGCLWDEFRGAQDRLEGVYERDVHWQDAAPEYGECDDPEGQWLIDLEMWVNGLLDDLMHGRGMA